MVEDVFTFQIFFLSVKDIQAFERKNAKLENRE